MGTFSTKLNIFTNNTLPVSVSSIRSKDFGIDGNYSEYGRLVLTSGIYEPLSTQDCGPHGAFVFAQSLPSNDPGTAIKLYVRPDFYTSGSEYLPVSQSIQSFATLYPGDTAMIPVTPQQKGLIASVTQDSATLDYYIGDRGGEFGHSVHVLTTQTKFSPTYEYFVMDAQLGETTPIVDTGVLISDWSFAYSGIVNNKGYMLAFDSGSLQQTVFVNTRGEIVNSSMPVIDAGTFFGVEPLDYYGYAYFYPIGGGVELTYFDGDSAYTHTFTGSTNVHLDNNYDSVNNVGCFVAYVTDYNGVSGDYATVLINKDKAYVLNILNSSTNQYAQSYVYNYAGFVFLSTYDSVAMTYQTIQFWDTNGNLMKSVDVSSYLFDTMDRFFYGTGKLQLVLHNSLDTTQPFYMINYDETVDVYQGDDLTWWHEQGTNFTNYKIYARNKSGLNPYLDSSTASSYYPESVAILFYTGSQDNTYFLNWTVNYADVTYLFPGSTHKNHVFASSSMSGSLLRIPSSISEQASIYPTSNNIVLNYNLVNSASGDLNALVITDAGVNTIQVIPDISVVNNGYYDIAFEPIGDYTMYGYYVSGDDQTYYKMITPNTVADTLILNGNEPNYRFRYNSLYIRTWSYANYNWYFNSATNAFKQIDTFYSRRYFTYGFGESGINNGAMLLVKPDYYTPTGSITGRVLTSNSITDEVTFPHAPYGSWEFYMGSESVVYIYTDQPDYVNSELHILVYDVNLNLKKTVSSSLAPMGMGEIYVVNDRIFLAFENGIGEQVYYMITQTTVQRKVVDTLTVITVDDGVWES